MKYDYIFIDFDQTLFNHYSYFDWLDKVLPSKDRRESFSKSLEQFHDDKPGNLRLYDHHGHIKHVTGDSWEFKSAEFQKLLKQQSKDFCFTDSHQFLRDVLLTGADIRILTYGKADYQRFKINICPLLRQLYIPVHVVTTSKDQFLKQNFKSGQGVLIDDKYPLNLPANWHHIWINRKSNIAVAENIDKTTTKVSSLIQTLELVK